MLLFNVILTKNSINWVLDLPELDVPDVVGRKAFLLLLFNRNSDTNFTLEGCELRRIPTRFSEHNEKLQKT